VVGLAQLANAVPVAPEMSKPEIKAGLPADPIVFSNGSMGSSSF
jgi:hypothetical protein